MAEIGHIGSWGTKELGITEGIQWALNLLPGVDTSSTNQGGSDLNRSSIPQPAQTPPSQNLIDRSTGTKPPVLGAADQNVKKPAGTTPNGQPTGDTNKNTTTLIDDAAQKQRDAAAQAAEAARQAAGRKYQAKVGIAGVAKDAAKGEYDWLTETLGSNKKDLLDQVNFNEQQGIGNYEAQDQKTQLMYDKARTEILSTYRDLNKEQEKIMRGSGMATSSRSQEAQLRLNNLLGKDMGSLTTNEADSLAMIANAVTTLKQQTLLTKNSIETETKGKLDKAALDYNNSIKAIDANLQLDANAREDEYANAEVKLSQDVAAVETWASGLKLQVQQTTAKTASMLDDFVMQLTDDTALLGTDLATKEAESNKLLQAAGFTALDQTLGIKDPTSGVYQAAKKSYNSKEELDAALQSGEITSLEYSNQLKAIQSQGGAGVMATTGSGDMLSRVALGGSAQPATSARDRIANADPLLASILA